MSCVHECACSCHKDGSIHNFPCCTVCPECNNKIESYRIIEHEQDCHLYRESNMKFYKVNIIDRIKNHCGEDFVLTPDISVTYSWENGYEKFEIKRKGGGICNFAGSYHPNVNCEGKGTCDYCGCTLTGSYDS